jgi:biotin transport system permease protein
MAEINVFHFRAGNTLLHRLDPRSKFFIMIFLSVSIINAGLLFLASLSALLLILLAATLIKTAGISLATFFREMRFFTVLFLVIIIVRGLNTTGNQEDILLYIFSGKGLVSGLVYSWRLALVFILGQLFALTTSHSSLQEGIYLLLKPVAFLPAGRIATMISLTIGFIPLVFDQYREIKVAWQARLGNMGRNPITRINSLTLPLLETILGRADEIAYAMESRCYSENPAWTELSMKVRDFLSIFLSATLLVAALFLKF